MTRVTPNGFTSREGYDVTIHDYSDKIVMTITDGVQETWNIKINVAVHKDKPLTPQELKLKELAEKYCAFSTGEECESFLPLPEKENSAIIDKKVVFDAIMKSFTFRGVEETLGIKVGQHTPLPYHVNITIVGVHVTFIRFIVLNRSGQAMNMQRIAKEQSNDGPFGLPNITRQTPHYPRSVKLPPVHYGLGSERSKLRQLANSIIKEGGVQVPAGRIERLITTLEIKYKMKPRKLAYEQSVNDLVDWFKRNTNPKN